jgi:hypothetical protein
MTLLICVELLNYSISLFEKNNSLIKHKNLIFTTNRVLFFFSKPQQTSQLNVSEKPNEFVNCLKIKYSFEKNCCIRF